MLDYTLNIHDHWIAAGNNVLGTECRAWFMPVADLYPQGSEFGTLVHCTTMGSDDNLLGKVGEVGKLRTAAQTSDILIRWHL
jgi:hypothetical protein